MTEPDPKTSFFERFCDFALSLNDIYSDYGAIDALDGLSNLSELTADDVEQMHKEYSENDSDE